MSKVNRHRHVPALLGLALVLLLGFAAAASAASQPESKTVQTYKIERLLTATPVPPSPPPARTSSKSARTTSWWEPRPRSSRRSGASA